MDLLTIADFNLVAAHGGVGRASRATGRAKATLSRRVVELEQSLGVRLFERGRRNLRLTEEGRALHERTTGLLTEIAHATEDIGSRTKRPRGRLRVSAPSLFSELAMGRIAAGFASAYPDVRLEVSVEDRPVDLIEEGYDLVIRVNPHPNEQLVGKCFLRDELLLVASPGFAQPRTSKGAKPVRAVVLTSAPEGDEWTILDRRRGLTFTPDVVLRLGTLTMIRDAVAAGAGAALLPHSLVADDLAQGRLISWGKAQGRLFFWGKAPKESEIWVLYSSRRLLSSKIAAFVAYLDEVFPKGSPEEVAVSPPTSTDQRV
jgi:DNA-binding transcriptional LysR family regulator